MSAHARKAYELESEFLTGVRQNFERLGTRVMRGAQMEFKERSDSADVRAALIDHEVFDRELEKAFPGQRSVTVATYERQLFVFWRETMRAMLTVAAPPKRYLSAESPHPISRAELDAHIRKMTHRAGKPLLLAVCSPSGFTDEVWSSPPETAGVKVILIAPRDGGRGWRVESKSEKIDPLLLRMFDPESAQDKLGRIRNALEERSGDLLTGSIAADDLADSLGLPVESVSQALMMIAAEDPELRLSRNEGTLLVYRGAAGSEPREVSNMSVTGWLTSLFSKKQNEAKKINMLSERRAALSQRRDRFYEDIGRLEEKEGRLTDEGKRNKSNVVRRRLAAQVAQLRRDIARANASAAMLNHQINVISTHIHNLTLIQQGEMAKLPNADELAEDAVRAEEMLENLRSDMDLVNNLDTGINETLMTEEEAAILAEFDADESVADSNAAPAARQKTSAAPSRIEDDDPQAHWDAAIADAEDAISNSNIDDEPDTRDKRIAE